MAYKKRIIEQEITNKLAASGAVLIKGQYHRNIYSILIRTKYMLNSTLKYDFSDHNLYICTLNQGNEKMSR